jgi:hypothetical protein
MLDIQIKEIKRLTNNAINQGKILSENEITQELSQDESIVWVTIPNVHGIGKSETFTLLMDKDKTICKTYCAIYGR